MNHWSTDQTNKNKEDRRKLRDGYCDFKNGHNESKQESCVVRAHSVPYSDSTDDFRKCSDFFKNYSVGNDSFYYNFDDQKDLPSQKYFHSSAEDCGSCNIKYQGLVQFREECRVVLDLPSDEIKEQNNFFINFCDQTRSKNADNLCNELIHPHSLCDEMRNILYSKVKENAEEVPFTHDGRTDSFFLKIPLTSQKIFRTVAYNKFNMDLIKKSINNFMVSLRREQDFALIKIEYSSIYHVLEALKSTIRGDIFYLISKNMNEDGLGQFNRCSDSEASGIKGSSFNETNRYHESAIANSMLKDYGHIPTFLISRDSIVINGNASEISVFESNTVCKKEAGHNTEISEILFNFEFTKFSMMEILCKDSLSRILVDTACEIACFGGISSAFIVKIFSDRLENIKACKRSLNDLYYTNILISWSESTVGELCDRKSYFDNIIFIRESTGRCSAFGNIENIQKSLKIDETLTESSFLVDFEMGDFICGKKFGKTMKISKSTDCVLDVEIVKKITLVGPEAQFNESEDPNEIFYKFKMRGKGTETLNCYRFLFDEFPVELCFDLDRKYHKKIIGMKGSTIQKIMKKYNIYAKFMSAKETFSSGFSGNVILKTPRKNFENLKKSQDEILSMAQEATSPSTKSLAGSLKGGRDVLTNEESEDLKESGNDREFYVKHPNITEIINQKNNLF